MPSIDPTRFARAVRQSLAERDMPQSDLAARAGLSTATISDYVNAKTTPTHRNAKKIVDLLGIDWQEITAVETDDADSILVPRAGFAAAGPGYSNDAYPRQGFDRYPRLELMRLTNAEGPALDHIRSVTVVGDSHLPEIMPNSRVLYLPVETFMGDGLYLISIDETEVVKRVQQKPGGALLFKSTNPLYETTELHPLKEADTPNTYRELSSGLTSTIRVVGKVIGYLKPA